MSAIDFTAKLHKPEAGDPTNSGVLLTLPKDASAKLPSRGMAMVQGTINNIPFRTVVEPNGKDSHWFKVGSELRAEAKADAGDTVTVSIEPSKEWREPKVPATLQAVLATDQEAQEIWNEITPMARWDWIRWIGAAKQEKTRQHRVDTINSRLKAGKRRPCCFDRTQCTLTDA
jgi:hypothetical protein